MKTINKALLFVGLLSLVFLNKAYTQQLPLTNQYVFAPGLLNPAAISVYQKMELFGLLRNQWSDVGGAPSNQMLTLNGSLKKNKTYLGTTIINDNIGLWNQISIYGNFAYTAKLNDDMNLDFGLAIGGIQRTFDYNRVVVKDVQDPYLTSNSLSRFGFDGSFGVYFSYKSLKVGISSLQLFGNKLSYVVEKNKSVYALTRQLNLTAQYSFVISDEKKMKLTPIGVVRYVADYGSFSSSVPLQYDFNVLFDYQKYGWLLVSYKSDYALAAGLGVHVNNAFHFGVSYDIAMFTPVQSYLGQTLELSFRYTFKSSGAASPQFLY
jgi:type IX secretion system PorP/SprF family membrane protein